MNPPFKHCPNCGSAGFLADDTGRILLIRRAKEPGRGRLATPGGFVDVGETAEAALRREIKEEVNLELLSVEYLISCPNEYLYRGVVYPVLDLFFTGRVRSWGEAVAAPGEVENFVLRDPMAVEPSELAFVSVVRALEFYRAGRAARP